MSYYLIPKIIIYNTIIVYKTSLNYNCNIRIKIINIISNNISVHRILGGHTE